MNKRTCDFDKLYEAIMLIAACHGNEHINWSKAIDAAFPLANHSDGITIIYQDEQHFIPQGVYDLLKERFGDTAVNDWATDLAAVFGFTPDGQAVSRTTHHGLHPLPESEWPENFSQTYYGKLCHDRHLVSDYDPGYRAYGTGYCERDDGNFPVSNDNYQFYFPTPQAALIAAGLPVELLDGLKRPESRPESPAHENPRVVAAAVEMVKEVEQHKAKRKKDREDWLEPFPAWVRESIEKWPEGDKLTPLRISDGSGFGYDSAKGWVVFHRGVGVYDGYVSLIDAACEAMPQKNNLPLYADGNVPLWGDEVDEADSCPGTSPRNGTVCEFDGGRLWLGENDAPLEVCRFKLLRRHQAIADLPGIVVETFQSKVVEAGDNPPTIEDIDAELDRIGNGPNDSSVDGAGSNGSAGGAIVFPQVALREGQRVTCEARYPNSVGFLVDHDPGSGRLEDRNTVCFGGTTLDTFRDDELIPIPPPLMDNGDGTWTPEGMHLFRIVRIRTTVWVACLLGPSGIPQCYVSLECPTKEAAAEDLWRRMEGVR